MKKIHLGFGAVAVAVALVVSVSQAVSAHDGVDHSTGRGHAEQTATTNSADRGTELRQKAQERVTELRRTAQAKTQEVRKRACEARKTSLQNKLTAWERAGVSYLQKVDNVFERAKAYMTDNNISGAPYDALVADATQWQTVATLTVNALKDLDTTVDCTSGEVATQLVNFQEAVQQTRSDLSDYKTKVKALLKALREREQS